MLSQGPRESLTNALNRDYHHQSQNAMKTLRLTRYKHTSYQGAGETTCYKISVDGLRSFLAVSTSIAQSEFFAQAERRCQPVGRHVKTLAVTNREKESNSRILVCLLTLMVRPSWALPVLPL